MVGGEIEESETSLPDEREVANGKREITCFMKNRPIREASRERSEVGTNPRSAEKVNIRQCADDSEHMTGELAVSGLRSSQKSLPGEIATTSIDLTASCTASACAPTSCTNLEAA